MVSLIPSELGLTMYSEVFPCIAAAAEEKCAARAAAAAADAEPREAPVRSVEAHKDYFKYDFDLMLANLNSTDCFLWMK